MKVFETINSLQQHLSHLRQNSTIGLVPTMGALHQGHLSIVKKAKKENKYVVATIFVNPTQFDNKEDLEKYPNTLKEDLHLLKEENCDIVFTPSVAEIYTQDIVAETMEFDGLDLVMEGAFRKGHFDGVGTIVKKLFEIVQPHNAYFGEKDFQQLQIIKKMVAKNELPVNIIPCAIFREKDGLAMSSRNTRLNLQQRSEAPLIYTTLLKSKKLFANNTVESIKNEVQQIFDSNQILDLEYFEIAETSTLQPTIAVDNHKKYRAFIAVYAGSIRLIDNIALN